MPVLAVMPALCPQETRLKEGIVKLKPHEEPLRSELLSGKFTILVGGGVPHPRMMPTGWLVPVPLHTGNPQVLREPDFVSSPECAGPLGSLHRPLHGQAASPQQECAACGAPGTLLPAGPSGGEVRWATMSYGSGSPGSPFPPQGGGRCCCVLWF